MKGRILSALAAILALTFNGCTLLGIFEDIGADPHPPKVDINTIWVLISEETPPAADQTPSPSRIAIGAPTAKASIDTHGFTIQPNTVIAFTISYFDLGADITSIQFRDRNGTVSVEFTPGPLLNVDLNNDGKADFPEGKYLPGVSGSANTTGFKFEATAAGAHFCELWAEDSHGSLSEKIDFIINVKLGYDDFQTKKKGN